MLSGYLDIPKLSLGLTVVMITAQASSFMGML